MRQLITILLLIALLGIQSPAYGQWKKHIIDDNLNTAVSIDAADINSDSKLDLIVTNAFSNQLIYYQNDYPDWNKHIIDANALTVTFAYTGDIDGDDTLDVVACLYSAKKMVWYENEFPNGWTQHIIAENTDWNDYVVVADSERLSQHC